MPSSCHSNFSTFGFSGGLGLLNAGLGGNESCISLFLGKEFRENLNNDLCDRVFLEWTQGNAL
tara:strand:+ start:77 stop:265 length:189 start_codon:yes stop_codon:yes gene_type:complete